MLDSSLRCRSLNDKKKLDTGPVLYWMERDQRAIDNWALYYACVSANENNVPLMVVFSLVEECGDMNWRHYHFMISGLKEVEQKLHSKNITFAILRGNPEKEVVRFVKKHNISQVFVDFNPLRTQRHWREKVAKQIPVSLIEVDTHNIVPVWEASDKLEFAAYTLRPKIHRKLGEWLKRQPKIPKIKVCDNDWGYFNDYDVLIKENTCDRDVLPVSWLQSGTDAGMKVLNNFTKNGHGYAHDRNDPNKNALSNLSPYMHFGQISPQRVAIEVASSDLSKEDREAYLEEVIVRRELSDNFCFYNHLYDTLEGAHEWAQKTIHAHRDDPREYVYTRIEFERAQTHDELWNAMQKQMVQTGKMHGWCRMYWAKKILEWTNTPEYAIKVALYLNDRYSLDGSDPNGVVGVMWSIAGVHDRAWTERPVFGKVRYMNYNGAKRKFDVKTYIERYGQVNEKLF